IFLIPSVRWMAPSWFSSPIRITRLPLPPHTFTKFLHVHIIGTVNHDEVDIGVGTGPLSYRIPDIGEPHVIEIGHSDPDLDLGRRGLGGNSAQGYCHHGNSWSENFC